MIKPALGLAACFLLAAACTIPEISTDVSGSRMKKSERPTGSNFARMKRDPDLEGWRQGYDRDDMREIQLARPLVGEGGGGKAGGKAGWYK